MLVELSVMEQRYYAVMEVASGAPVSEVARRYGVSRQACIMLITPGLTQTPCGRRPCRRRASYQSAWTTVPLCSVTTVALAIHAGTSEDISGQFADSCQCLAMPAGDS